MKRLRVERNKATVFFDLETTGFNPLPTGSSYNRTVQISAQVLESGLFFDSFVNPGMEICKRSENIHKVTNDMVQDSDNIVDTVKRMWKQLCLDDYDGGVTMIAHNCYEFDKIIFMRECGAILKGKNISFWDTLPWLRRNLNNVTGKDGGEKINVFKLEFLYEFLFGKPLENAHRSDADVRALVAIYEKFIQPNLTSEDVARTEAFHSYFNETMITSVKYLGVYRACLIQKKLGLETLSELKEHVKLKCEQQKNWLDIFLKNEIRMMNKSHRIIVIANLLDLNLYEMDKVKEYLCKEIFLEDCVDQVDYYIKYRYVERKRPRNLYHYERGLQLFRLKGEEK